MPRDRRHILVTVHDDPFHSAAILRGVGEFARARDCYLTVFSEKREGLPAAISRSRCDGALVLVDNDPLALKIRDTGIPAVNLINLPPHDLLPAVRPDDRSIGRLAAAHLLDQGFKRLAFYGCGQTWSIQRFEGFCEVLRGHGITPVSNAYAGRFPTYIYADHPDRYRKFVASLEPPAAVFGCNDGMASKVLSTALDSDLLVPDDVAVIGCDNVERYCIFGKVEMSSIDPDVQQIALDAAKLLQRLMDGERAPKAPILVPPRKLLARRSTDLLAYDDPTVAAAMRLIREHARSKYTVDELLEQVNVSRSWLERRFAQQVGRSPGEEIRRTRLEHARELLLETSMPLASIADACGFEYLSHFSAAFKRQFGQPPSKLRSSRE